MQQLTNTELHEQERKRVHFKHHLVLFLVINTIFWSIWYVTGSGYQWPIWPMALWCGPVIFHYLNVWGE